ncbi:hypothetical protein ACGFNV_12975 [Streptomyces sp. NPDC048751]|uniref:hypothetical protein n=1 Tax=Streptomyces sp. NPDC048751 TaxID=3365591 RepID=UPI00371A245F
MVSRALLFSAGVVALGGLSAVVFGPWQAGLLLLVLGLTCVAFAGVRVTVDGRGLTVASTVLPRPRLVLPLGSIDGASSVQISALGDFGGWGYRIRPNRRGVVLRSGRLPSGGELGVVRRQGHVLQAVQRLVEAAYDMTLGVRS